MTEGRYPPDVCGLALEKADGDDTLQWPPRRSATRNDPVLAIFLTPSPPPPQSPDWPSAGRTTSVGPSVNAVSCLRPISDIFPTKCKIVVVQDDRMS